MGKIIISIVFVLLEGCVIEQERESPLKDDNCTCTANFEYRVLEYGGSYDIYARHNGYWTCTNLVSFTRREYAEYKIKTLGNGYRPHKVTKILGREIIVLIQTEQRHGEK